MIKWENFIYRSRTKAVIGPNDVYPRYGDLQGAWGSGNSTSTNDNYIEVQ